MYLLKSNKFYGVKVTKCERVHVRVNIFAPSCEAFETAPAYIAVFFFPGCFWQRATSLVKWSCRCHCDITGREEKKQIHTWQLERAILTVPFHFGVKLTLQTYWLRAPGENVWERTMGLPRINGDAWPQRPPLSLGRTRTGSGNGPSVIVAFSTWNKKHTHIKNQVGVQGFLFGWQWS